MASHISMEVAKTVLEVADVAWTAVECCHHHHHDQPEESASTDPSLDRERGADLGKLEALRSENKRLRTLLQHNLNLLHSISESPISHNCPPDLHDRLVSAVNSRSFLVQLESQCNEANCTFPFKEASGEDLETAEILIDVDQKEPSWWVWVTDEMVPSNIEERSEIDNENYVIVSEEHVVDGVANFMAKCIVSNTKAKDMSPEQLQKAIIHSLGGMNKVEKMVHIWHAGKMFYTISTWGLALTGLYSSREVLRLALSGVHTSSKVILKAL